jgi:hypothetical protein
MVIFAMRVESHWLARYWLAPGSHAATPQFWSFPSKKYGSTRNRRITVENAISGSIGRRLFARRGRAPQSSPVVKRPIAGTWRGISQRDSWNNSGHRWTIVDTHALSPRGAHDALANLRAVRGRRSALVLVRRRPAVAWSGNKLVLQALVRPVTMIEGTILKDNIVQMFGAQHEEMSQAFDRNPSQSRVRRCEPEVLTI